MFKMKSIDLYHELKETKFKIIRLKVVTTESKGNKLESIFKLIDKSHETRIQCVTVVKLQDVIYQSNKTYIG